MGILDDIVGKLHSYKYEWGEDTYQVQKYRDLFKKGEYKSALGIIDSLLVKYDKSVLGVRGIKDNLLVKYDVGEILHYDKAVCLFHLSKNDSEPVLRKTISLAKEKYSILKQHFAGDVPGFIIIPNNYIIRNCMILLAELYKNRGEMWVARDYYLTAMEELSEEGGVTKVKSGIFNYGYRPEEEWYEYKISEENGVAKIKTLLFELEENSKEEWDNYLNREYNDRKLIMPIDDDHIAGCVAEGIDVFRMSNIPSRIKFPIGHPVSGQLYIGHPFKQDLYVPYEMYEETFFVDKVHELCDLLQCLGATDIAIESVKGRSVNELYNDNLSVDVEVGVKEFSGGGSYGHSSHRNKIETNNSRRAMHFTFDPMHKPYVPKGLVWYPESTEWQRLVQNRINGNMLEYSEYLSTVQTRMVNSTEEEKIKASAGYLWAKANVNVEKSTSNSFKESVETEWKVSVTFRSIREMNKNAQLQGNTSSATALSTNEQEYIETLKEIIAEYGEITDRDRKSLERIRKMSGISEERAKELEDFLTKPSLTADEQEYYDSIKEIIAEYGEITERDRKSLERIRKMSGISEERAREIEKMV